MLIDGTDLIPLLSIIPNIHCLRISIEHTRDMFESLLWSSTVLSDLIEFDLWAETAAHNWTIDELVILLSIMPNLQRLSLNIVTSDVSLLDGEQIRSALSVVNNLCLDKFQYAVEYSGPRLSRNIIFNFPQKWLPQPIAFISDVECHSIHLHTIPFKFHRFWTQMTTPETKKLRREQEIITCYGEGAYIAHCNSNISTAFSDLYDVMEKSCHVKKLTLWLPYKTERNIFGKYFENILQK